MKPAFMQDLGAIIWKELREFFAAGGGRGRYVGLIVLGVFGVVIPLAAGTRDWAATDAPTIEFGLYLPVILILSVGADAFAGERERHTLETLLASRLPDSAILFGKLFAISIFGWGQSLPAAVVALIVMNLKFPGALILYTLSNVIGIILIGLLAAIVGAAATSLVSLRAATVRQAQQILTIAMLVVVFGGTFGLQVLPASFRAQLASGLGFTLALAAIAALLILWALALFRRSRLILSGS